MPVTFILSLGPCQDNVKTNPHYLKVRGIPLGILPKWEAKPGELVLAAGDILLLASDGITEAQVLIKDDLTTYIS